MPNPKWSVKAVKPLQDYMLQLTFESGEERLYDAKPLLQKQVCAALREPDFFDQARAAYGTVVWSDEIDIAPEHLYECSVPVESGE